ncbi:MAG: ABC transporter ATP-binding protein [Bacteroidota bacterium]|jgi:ABC-2 type transport system ATP-binding protein
MQQDVNILEFENLIKTYESGVRAVDGLTLSVPRGSIFGFIGLNGAGKTSTIRILAGLSQKDSGGVRFLGKEITRREFAYKQEIGFVLDEPLYFEWMSAREYLEFVGTMYNLPSQDAARRGEELLEFFDLHEKQDDPIKTFSTGMKKKISLAAAIIHKPKLVVLDEPLEGIDALAASAVKESLAFMASQGTSIFITSHVLDTVERFCTEVAIIHRGKILLQCPTTDIRSKTMGRMSDQTYASLEELFVDLVSDKVRRKHPSWL